MNMKTNNCIVIAVVAVMATANARAQESIPVERAVEILQTSLIKRDRINAVAALRNAKGAAAPATESLARIVAIDPVGDEAGYAAEALGYIGKKSIPLVADLISNGFDWTYLCASRTLSRFPRKLEPDVMAAFRPILQRGPAWERFPAILALRWFDLSPDSANHIAETLLSDRFYTTKMAAALFIAPRGNDPALLRQVEAQPLGSMRYLAASIQEKWRRRDSPLHQRVRLSHVPIALPAEEETRCKDAEAKLAELAKAAISEAIDHLRRADTEYERYLWMEMLKSYSEHVPLPTDQTIAVLESVERKNGRTINAMLKEFSEELQKKGTRNRAADKLRPARIETGRS